MSDVTVDLSNTPGIYYAISYWLSCLLYIGMNTRKLTGRKLGSIAAFFFDNCSLYDADRRHSGYFLYSLCACHSLSYVLVYPDML